MLRLDGKKPGLNPGGRNARLSSELLSLPVRFLHRAGSYVVVIRRMREGQ
jgi:hypothetical protein